MELASEEGLEGVAACKLKITKKSRSVEYDYLDVKTSLPIKTEVRRKQIGPAHTV